MNNTLFTRSIFLFVVFFAIPVTSVPAAPLTGTWRFAVIADTRGSNVAEPGKSGINDRILPLLAGAVANEKVDLVLVAGDLVNGGHDIPAEPSLAAQLAVWRKAMGALYDAGIPVYPVRGNHEVGSNSGNARRAELFLNDYHTVMRTASLPQNGPEGEKGLTYSFVHKNALFIGFDQYVNRLKINQSWLDGILAAPHPPHIFTFGHATAFTVSSRAALSRHPVERDRFWNSLGRAGARLYLTGHDHLYDRLSVSDNLGNQLQQIVAGTGGGPFTRAKPDYGNNERVKPHFNSVRHYGYLLITVDEKRVTVAFKGWEGNSAPVFNTIDSFSYDIGAAASEK